MAKAPHVYDVLRRPIITEKSTYLAERAKYVFEIRSDANKFQVKEAVERAFNVEVVKVNTMNLLGKPKRAGRSARFVHHSWKKAVVTLAAGHKIDIFEGV